MRTVDNSYGPPTELRAALGHVVVDGLPYTVLSPLAQTRATAHFDPLRHSDVRHFDQP